MAKFKARGEIESAIQKLEDAKQKDNVVPTMSKVEFGNAAPSNTDHGADCEYGIHDDESAGGPPAVQDEDAKQKS